MKLHDFKKLMNLQFFSDSEGDGGDGNGTGAGDGAGNSGNDGDKSFEDFLKDPKNQAEFDRRVAKALNTQKEKLDGEYQTSLEEAKKEAEKEAEKLAEMNAEQKKQYEAEKTEQLIKDQQKEIERLTKEATRAELSKEASRIMKADHSIIATQDMLDFVVGDDADTTKANISKLVGIIQEDRKLQEEKRATGRTPRSYSSSGNMTSEIDRRIAKYQ